MSIVITTAQITLTTIQITEITTIKESLETQIVLIQKNIELLQTSILTVSGAIASETQIATGKENGKNSDIVLETILSLKIAVQHMSILIKIQTVLSSAIAGTLNSGIETTSSAFVTLVTNFITLVSADVLDITILTMSTSLTTVKVTLTSSDITMVTSQLASLEKLIAQLDAMVLMLQTKIESITSTFPTTIQIISGSVVADIETARQALLVEMKILIMSIKVNKFQLNCIS
jgi:hypothetical protein